MPCRVVNVDRELLGKPVVGGDQTVLDDVLADAANLLGRHEAVQRYHSVRAADFDLCVDLDVPAEAVLTGPAGDSDDMCFLVRWAGAQ